MALKNYKWYDNYPIGVNKEIDPDKYSSVVDLLNESFEKYSDLPAYDSFGVSITYKQLDKLSLDFASFLQNEVGLKKGDRLAIQMPNLLQYPIAMFGALRAGLIVVNTNPLYTPREMEHQLKDAGVKAIVILANFASNLEKILKKTDIEQVVITEIGDMLGWVKKPIVNFVVKNVKKMVPPYHLEGTISFNQALKKGKASKFIKCKTESKDIAFLQYTGGTTGVAKGAMLTHRNLIANMLQNMEWMKPKLLEREEIVITALPLYHIFALTVNCLTFLKMGARNVLITNPRDMPAFLKELKKYKFTVFTGVNTLFNGLLNRPEFAKLDFSNFKIAVGGGMAVQKVVAEKWQEVTGTTLAEGYGLTETSPVLSCNPIDGNEKIGTIGLPFPNTDIAIMDDEGNELPEGQDGEICAKGPQVMPGYWNNEAETDMVFRNGWFKTGDIGRFDKDGYLKIVDRKKEMINVSGFNVYPNEIENIVAAHPKVLEVGAVGVPDHRSNEVVKIFVVKKDPSLTQEELLAYCRENLTPYKVPKQIEFKEALPKSNIGKILRRLLVEEEVV
ncbi:MAG: AMP-binding protein [Candidatus Cyclobacteriaceae bacterium M3_2C_046]